MIVVVETDGNIQKVKSALIPTWQSLAAIAYLTGLPVRTVEKICIELWNKGEIKATRARLDGHNKVHLFKSVEYITVFGQRMPVEKDEVA